MKVPSTNIRVPPSDHTVFGVTVQGTEDYQMPGGGLSPTPPPPNLRGICFTCVHKTQSRQPVAGHRCSPSRYVRHLTIFIASHIYIVGFSVALLHVFFYFYLVKGGVGYSLLEVLDRESVTRCDISYSILSIFLLLSTFSLFLQKIPSIDWSYC